MRALALLVVAACTPDIAPGSYLCGPEASCPPDQACSGSDNHCVLAGLETPFECTADADFEPDNSAVQAHALPTFNCVSAPFANNSCMPVGDAGDWMSFVAPNNCAGAVQVQVRLGFPIAFEELGIELWDLDRNMKLASEAPCTSGAELSVERRCLDFTLMPSTTYGIAVLPTGMGTCGGNCAYNRYTLSIQLGTP